MARYQVRLGKFKTTLPASTPVSAKTIGWLDYYYVFGGIKGLSDFIRLATARKEGQRITAVTRKAF